MKNLALFQETKGSPTKDRVFTLPSISEDEEESDSVDEESKSQEKSRDDDDDDVSQTSRLMSPTASMSSPLLANHRPFKLPNGDIDVFNRYAIWGHNEYNNGFSSSLFLA